MEPNTPAPEPAAPPEPATPPPAAPAPQGPDNPGDNHQQSTGPHHTDVMGIISIILDFVGFPFIGFILGLVGASKAKKAGHSATLSRIGWILGLIFTIISSVVIVFLVMVSFKETQALNRDTDRKNEVNSIAAKLEAYASSNNGFYPGNLDELNLTDDELTDAKGIEYDYSPLPSGCEEDCTTFTISADMESISEQDIYPTGKYTLSGSRSTESLDEILEGYEDIQ